MHIAPSLAQIVDIALGVEGITGVLYLAVAYFVWHRPATPTLRYARDAFAFWWLALGVLSAVGIITRTSGAFTTDALGTLLASAILLLLAGGSAGLAYYQAVLSGRFKEPAVVVGMYYGALFLAYLLIVISAGPQFDDRFGRLVYNNTWLSPDGVLHPMLTVGFFWLLLGPGLLGAAWLLWRSDSITEPDVRDRAYTIGGALFVWYLFVLVGSLSILSGSVPEWLAFTARVINLFAVTSVLVAVYRADRHMHKSLLTFGKPSELLHADRPKAVLLVDDEQPILDTLSAVLGDLLDRPVEITTATTGEQAMEALDAAPFDLILCDYRMKQVTGADVLEHAAKIHPDAVRILVTGYAEESIVEEAIQRSSVHDYVLKPWDTDELVRKLDRWLSDEGHVPMEREAALEFLHRTRALV